MRDARRYAFFDATPDAMVDYAAKADDFMSKAQKKLNVRPSRQPPEPLPPDLPRPAISVVPFGPVPPARRFPLAFFA